MSLIGKILALLNIFGALGLVYVAMLDYGKRQTWAYSYYRHELVLNGLPLPILPKERDPEKQPIDDRMSKELSEELFGPLGGNPVTTQTQEVERVQARLDARLQAAQGKPTQAYLLSRILLPLADNYLEREQMLACRVHFATDVTIGSLKKRCEVAFKDAIYSNQAGLARSVLKRRIDNAFRDAVLVYDRDFILPDPEKKEKPDTKPMSIESPRIDIVTKLKTECDNAFGETDLGKIQEKFTTAFKAVIDKENDEDIVALKEQCDDAFKEAIAAAKRPSDKSFPDAFRLAFRAQSGEPAEYFTSLVLTKLELDDKGKPKAKNADAAFTDAIDAQHTSLEGRFQQLFADARGTSNKTKSDTPTSSAAQRAAVARLLFGVSLFLAEDEILTADGKADLSKVLEAEPYRMNIRRTYVVCGLKASLEAISERAAALRGLSGYVQQSFGQERLQFLFDHAAIIEQLREHAAIVREEEYQIAGKPKEPVAGNERKRADYDKVVNDRREELTALTKVLAKSRSQTPEEIAKLDKALSASEKALGTKQEIANLRELSERVLDLRLRVRDAIRDNDIGEKRIRELEKKILDLEK